MRAFVIHDADGNVVGLVRAYQDEAPPVTSGGGGLRALEFQEEADEVITTADEGDAVARIRALRVDLQRRVVGRSSDG